MDLIGIALLLIVAVVALLVTVLDALGQVLVAAVAAIVRVLWRRGQLIRFWARNDHFPAVSRPDFIVAAGNHPFGTAGGTAS